MSLFPSHLPFCVAAVAVQSDGIEEVEGILKTNTAEGTAGGVETGVAYKLRSSANGEIHVSPASGTPPGVTGGRTACPDLHAARSFICTAGSQSAACGDITAAFHASSCGEHVEEAASEEGDDAISDSRALLIPIRLDLPSCHRRTAPPYLL